MGRAQEVADRAKLLRTRFDLSKQLIVQSRRGFTWGRTAAWPHLPTAAPETSSLQPYLDGHEEGPGIWKWQHYFPIYDRHFAKFKGREVHVVEIGIYSGGSLGMWRHFFGPQAHVYGIDISEACKAYEQPGIDVFIGDQADPAFWAEFNERVPKVDIVIDDGGHHVHQQIATLEAVLPHLQPGGVYLCEDIASEYNPTLDYLFGLSRNLHRFTRRERGKRGREVTDVQRAIDSIHFYPWVAVIEKRDGTLDRFLDPMVGSEWQPPTFWSGHRAD